MPLDLWGCILKEKLEVQELKEAHLQEIEWSQDGKNIIRAKLVSGRIGEATGKSEKIMEGYFTTSIPITDVVDGNHSSEFQRPSVITLEGGQVCGKGEVDGNELSNVTVIDTKVIEGALTGVENSYQSRLSDHMLLYKNVISYKILTKLVMV